MQAKTSVTSKCPSTAGLLPFPEVQMTEDSVTNYMSELVKKGLNKTCNSYKIHSVRK